MLSGRAAYAQEYAQRRYMGARKEGETVADKNICLSAAEWNLMERLREASPRTEFEAAQLEGRTV